MGHPWFQLKAQAEKDGVVALSANFTLYGDISDRMMSIAAGLGPRQEIYSIDESFIELTGVKGNLTERARLVRERILMWTGIPCGIGIGTTKTLAKLANHVAKSADRKPGSYPTSFARVANLVHITDEEFQAVLEATPLEEIWGIGPKISAAMKEAGLSTAWEVRCMDPTTARRRWSVGVERTVRELQGTSCIDLEDAPPAKQEIACTRSFGKAVTDPQELIEAVSTFASRAAQKLRQQEGHASEVLTFVRTSPFRKQDRQYSRSVIVPLQEPTADTNQLVQAALLGLQAIYRPGYNYAKAGVMLLGLQSNTVHQGTLDLGDRPVQRAGLMSALDSLNDRYGRGSIGLASAGIRKQPRNWVMKQGRQTPQYTTRWEDMPVVRA